MADNVFTRHDSRLGTGIADDFYMYHNGTDSYLVNDTGDTYIQTTTAAKKLYINNGSGNDFVFDFANLRLGVNCVPTYEIEVQKTGAPARIHANQTDGATAVVQGAGSYGFIGTTTTHHLRLIANNAYKVEVQTTGDVMIPAAYTTVIGGVNTDLYIDNTGLIGPNPSSIRYKENVRDITGNDTDFIYNLRVRKADYKNGGPVDQLCLIAEETAPVNQKLIRYALFENGKMIDRTKYSNIQIAEQIQPDIKQQVELIERYIDENGVVQERPVSKELTKLLTSVNKSDLIFPLLHQVQLLNERLKKLENPA